MEFHSNITNDCQAIANLLLHAGYFNLRHMTANKNLIIKYLRPKLYLLSAALCLFLTRGCDVTHTELANCGQYAKGLNFVFVEFNVR